MKAPYIKDHHSKAVQTKHEESQRICASERRKFTNFYTEKCVREQRGHEKHGDRIRTMTDQRGANFCVCVKKC